MSYYEGSPMYDDSILGILVPYCRMFTTLMFYIVMCGGIISLLVVCATPVFMIFNGYKSITIKAKKSKKISKKELLKQKKQSEDKYFKKLDKRTKKT